MNSHRVLWLQEPQPQDIVWLPGVGILGPWLEQATGGGGENLSWHAGSRRLCRSAKTASEGLDFSTDSWKYQFRVDVSQSLGLPISENSIWMLLEIGFQWHHRSFLFPPMPSRSSAQVAKAELLRRLPHFPAKELLMVTWWQRAVLA